MDKKFLPSSYKPKLYLKASSLNQKNLKAEEYIREFEQLQIRVGLNEELKLKIIRFIKGLSPNISNKLYLQPYICFEDVCSLVIKVEKEFRGRKSVHTSSLKAHPIIMILK